MIEPISTCVLPGITLQECGRERWKVGLFGYEVLARCITKKVVWGSLGDFGQDIRFVVWYYKKSFSRL